MCQNFVLTEKSGVGRTNVFSASCTSDTIQIAGYESNFRQNMWLLCQFMLYILIQIIPSEQLLANIFMLTPTLHNQNPYFLGALKYHW